MALARARFRPSTVISTAVPRATPSGETELSVGGVVRLPAANNEPAQKTKVSRAGSMTARHPDGVNFKVAIEEPRCEFVPGRRELEAERPVGQLGNGADLGEIGRAEQLDITVCRRRRQQLAIGRPCQ